jgi:outer membrane protein OmpA-like peptidoglycan-associated protein
MMAEQRQTAKVPGRPHRLAQAAFAALILGLPAMPALADSPAVEVNPKALDAVVKADAAKSKAKKESSKPKEVAALPSATRDAVRQKFGGRTEQILFTGDQDALSAEAIQKLSALADDLTGNDVRLQLSSYGGSSADTASAANRLALKHALLVRDYLVGKGIDESRVIVRALGPAPSGPNDRVDVEFLLNN